MPSIIAVFSRTSPEAGKPAKNRIATHEKNSFMRLEYTATLQAHLCLRRTPADADRLTRDLVARFGSQESHQVCNFSRFDHFTERNARHRFLLEFFNRNSLRSRDIAHSGAGHFCVGPAR